MHQSDLFAGLPDNAEGKQIASLRRQIDEEIETLGKTLEAARPALYSRRAAWDALKAAVNNPEKTREERRKLYDDKDLACRVSRPWITRLRDSERFIRLLEKELNALLGPIPGKRLKKQRPSLLPKELTKILEMPYAILE